MMKSINPETIKDMALLREKLDGLVNAFMGKDYHQAGMLEADMRRVLNKYTGAHHVHH